MEAIDVKSWALIISLLAFTLSLVTFVKTQIWRTIEFNCRMLEFSWSLKDEELFCESKFFISSSGNQNIYIDKLYIIQGNCEAISDSSISIDVNKLLKPGEIEEFICKTDASKFSHNTTYSFIFTLISAHANQFHCSLHMTTKKQVNNSPVISPKKMGGGNFSLNTFSFWRNYKVRQSNLKRLG